MSSISASKSRPKRPTDPRKNRRVHLAVRPSPRTTRRSPSWRSGWPLHAPEIAVRRTPGQALLEGLHQPKFLRHTDADVRKAARSLGVLGLGQAFMCMSTPLAPLERRFRVDWAVDLRRVWAVYCTLNRRPDLPGRRSTRPRKRPLISRSGWPLYAPESAVRMTPGHAGDRGKLIQLAQRKSRSPLRSPSRNRLQVA